MHVPKDDYRPRRIRLGQHLVLAALLLAAGCGDKTFSTTLLPDGFEVAETGGYTWFYFPYGEGGVHYTFIGVGWLAHDERGDVSHLRRGDEELATTITLGHRGWEFTPAGKALLEGGGWAAGSKVFGRDAGSQYVVGAARWADPPGAKPDQPSMKTTRDPYYFNDRSWTFMLKPAAILSEPCDSAVFLCDGTAPGYVRLAGFNSDQHEFRGVEIRPGKEIDEIVYRLTERDTGKAIEGRFRYNRYSFWRRFEKARREDPPPPADAEKPGD